MNVIISNSADDALSSLNIDVIKKIHGEFSVEEIISMFENFFYDFIGIIDFTNGSNGKSTVVGTNDKRLWLKIGNAADAQCSLHFINILFKLGSERRIFDVMNLPLQSDFRIARRHTATACAEMRVVVRAEEHVGNHITVTDCAKIASHNTLLTFR